mmetsp:Transcript_39368/g.64495  ORF Transcript_39368/g.64495 Transcript_39368/m.64495 type:complete len:582 (-) Transcript_39368:327-2072(-)
MASASGTSVTIALVIAMILNVRQGHCVSFKLDDKVLNDSSPLDYRNNFCERKDSYKQNNVTLENSLAGMNISAIIYAGNQSANHYSLHVWDTMAQTLGFNYELHTMEKLFYSSSSLGFGEDGGDDWIEFYESAARHVDVVIDLVYVLGSRSMNYGIEFVGRAVKEDIILLTKKTTSGTTFWSDCTKFADPFHWEVWGLLILFSVTTALVILVISFNYEVAGPEGGPKRPKKSKYKSKAKEAGRYIWNGFQLITGSGGFDEDIKSPIARSIILSWSFVVLVSVSSYTANLTTFLVNSDSVEYGVESLASAISSRTALCYTDSTVKDLVTEEYPRVNWYTSNGTWASINEALDDGSCGGLLLDDATFVLTRMQGRFTCDMVVIDDSVIEVSSSFLVNSKHGYATCHNFLNQVLDAGLQSLSENGNLTKMYDNFQTNYQNADGCVSEGLTYYDSATSDSDDDTAKLYVKDLSGVFILHILVVAVCVLLRWASTLKWVQHEEDKVKNSKSFRFVSDKFKELDAKVDEAVAEALGNEDSGAPTDETGRAEGAAAAPTAPRQREDAAPPRSRFSLASAGRGSGGAAT